MTLYLKDPCKKLVRYSSIFILAKFQRIFFIPVSKLLETYLYGHPIKPIYLSVFSVIQYLKKLL